MTNSRRIASSAGSLFYCSIGCGIIFCGRSLSAQEPNFVVPLPAVNAVAFVGQAEDLANGPSAAPNSLKPNPNSVALSQEEFQAIMKRLNLVEASNQSLEKQLEQASNRQDPEKDSSKEPAEKKDTERKDKDNKPSEDKKESKDSAKKDGDKKSDSKSDKKEDGWLDVSTEKWTVKMGGHVQMDYINWASASPAIPNQNDYFEFRRLRITAEGTGYGTFDFRLQMTMEPETVGESPPGTVTSPEVKDAYFSVNEIPLIGRWRIGNFFVPFSLEQITNDTFNIFMERSIPTQGVFAADREVGMAIYNCTDDKNLSWATGVFFDSVSEALKERIDDNQGYRVSGRLNWLPYYDEPSNGRYLIHTGIGILHTQDQDKRVRFRARPQVRESPRIIDSGVIEAGSYTTGNLESAIVFGRATLQSEAFLSSVNRLVGDSVKVTGAYSHLSYFLTGESRAYERFGQHGAQFGRNTPFTNFFMVPGGYGWGAWEAKVRWSYLDLSQLDRGQYNDISSGFNWYWSDRTRIMFDWIHPTTTSQAVFGQTQSNLLATRFDFNW